MTKKLIALLFVVGVVFSFVIFFRLAGGLGAETLWKLSDSGKWLLPLVAVAALIDSINPCAFSILLVTIAFLFSIGKLRSGVMKIGGSYIFGIFVVYILIGLGVLQALHFFNTPNFMAKAGAFLLVILGGINLIYKFFPSFPF